MDVCFPLLPEPDAPVYEFRFKHLKTLGFLPYMSTVSKKEYAKPIVDTHLLQYLQKVVPLNFGFPTVNLQSYERRIMRGDKPHFEVDLPDQVLNFVIPMVQECFRGCGLSDPSTLEINLKTAASLPFTGLKKDVVYSELVFDSIGCERPVYRKADPKTDELVSEKAMTVKGPRIFYSTDLTSLLEEKMFFELQNKAFNKRSRMFGGCIGMSMLEGGFHATISAHASKKYHVSGDTLSQDLTNTFMPLVYAIRRRCLVCPSHLLDLLDTVCDRLVSPRVMLINGQVVQMTRLAVSGSNNVTQDNTIAYLMLLVYVLYLNSPSSFVDDFYSSVISIYGDDWLLSSDDIGLTSRTMWLDAWRDCDMTLKFLIISTQLQDHSFLGSAIIKREYFGSEWWCRVPSREKVLAGLVRLPRSMSGPERYVRLLSSLQLLVHTEIFDRLYDYAYSLALECKLSLQPRTYFLYKDLGLEGSFSPPSRACFSL